MNNEQGSVTPFVLFVSVAVLSLAVDGLYSLNYLRNLGHLQQTSNDIRRFAGLAKLLFADSAVCTDHLLNGPNPVSGSSLKDTIQAKLANPSASSNSDINVTYPGTQVSLFAPGVQYNSITLGGVSVESVVQIPTTSNSYLARTRMELKTSVGTFKPYILPIYIVTDGSGTMVSCRVSRFTEANFTVEDFLCQGLNGASTDFAFEPKDKKCIQIN